MKEIVVNTAVQSSSIKQKCARLIRRHGLLGGFVGALVVGLVGCSITGGGWIPSAGTPGSKATFGIDIAGDLEVEDFANGNLTLQDKSFRSPSFPSGVNAHAGPTFILAAEGGGVGLGGIAFAVAPCTMKQGGNGGAEGTIVALGIDTALVGSHKGDAAAFVIYPSAPSTPEEAALIGELTVQDLLVGGVGILNEAIYVNFNSLGNGGPGGGNLTVDGSTVNLGGSTVSLLVLATLAVGATALRLRSHRSMRA